MQQRLKFLVLALIPLAFFLWGLVALPDYGVNVDEPLHFMRGQAYLNLYLSGSKDYSNLEGFQAWREARELQQEQQRTINREHGLTPTGLEELEAIDVDEPLALEQISSRRFSVYQETTFTAQTFLEDDVGHPPLNGILAAVSNKIFYQELGWIGDVESYHLFEITIATLGILLVMWWAYLEFGVIASLIAGLALALHPMYLGESRFNIKDPIETVFFAATLFAVWQAVKIGREKLQEDRIFKWLLAGGAAFGIAVATKFNAFFVLPILGLWLIAMLLATPLVNSKFSIQNFQLVLRTWFNRGMLWGIPLALLLAAAITYAGWPDIWEHPIRELKITLDFYYQLGTSEQYAKEFLTEGGWNLYPLLDVLLRAPLVTLLLMSIGLAGFVRYWRTPQFATLLLWAIWLVIPILRVTLPDKALYGATRQIMEYLPALALFAGVGASMLVEVVSKEWSARTGKTLDVRRETLGKDPTVYRLPSTVSTIATTAIILAYLPILITLHRYHPNPQLFYNSLIGGLKGAYAMDFPSWNNTMNNAYTVGVDWLNENAKPGTRLALVNALGSSLPPKRLRDDIQLANFYFSGPLEEGEYIMELEPLKPTSFIPKYVERYLEPVFTYEVDGVPLLRIWQNDGLHRRQNLTLAPEPIAPTEIKSDGQSLILDFGAIHRFHRLELIPAEIGTAIGETETPCVALTEGALSISTDGTTWQRLENVPYVGVNRLAYQTHTFPDYLLAGDHLRYVNIGPNEAACLLQPVAVRGWIYDDQG